MLAQGRDPRDTRTRVDSPAPWTCTSIREKSSFAGTGFPSRRAGSRRPPPKRGRPRRTFGSPVVVKAQVLTGGRGKAGGIKLASDADEAESHAAAILGMDIRGHTVAKVWVEEASDIEREYYLSLTFDRSAKKPLFMFTTQGGIDIEEVAENSPDALVRLHVDPLEGCQPWHARRLVYDGGVSDPSERKQIAADGGEAVRGVRRDRGDAVRDQSADRHAGRRGASARLEVHGRRQRALPAPGPRGDARRRCRGSPRGTRAREGSHVRQARRRGRCARERRRV